jgi:hypothetical protein
MGIPAIDGCPQEKMQSPDSIPSALVVAAVGARAGGISVRVLPDCTSFEFPPSTF